MVPSALRAALVAAVGLGLAVWTEQWLCLAGALVLSLLALAWRLPAWLCFCVRVDERSLTVRTLEGWRIKECVIPLNSQEGFVLRRWPVAWPLDLGELTIRVQGRPVRLRWIARFKALKDQIERAK
ncbi:MAG: hypothetical protein OHK0022_03510 [Roseiflexaceae bacterium]